MNTITNQSQNAYSVSNSYTQQNTLNKSIDMQQSKEATKVKPSVKLDISSEGKNLLKATQATYQRPVTAMDDMNRSEKVAASSGTNKTAEEQAEIKQSTLNNSLSNAKAMSMGNAIGTNFDVRL